MIVTKENIADIIFLAKTMVDNHEDELQNNDVTANRIRTIADALDAGTDIQVIDENYGYCPEASGAMHIEVYSAIISNALKMYNEDIYKMFKALVDKHDSINVAKATTLVACYLLYSLPSSVLNIIRNNNY